MARLTLSFLGGFQAYLGELPITSFESDKVRALLAYLAVESGRPQPREKLAGLLWPDWPEGAARANLSHVLTNLRRAVGDRDAATPVLLATRQTVQFNRAADAFVDVTAFAALTGRRDLSTMEQAVELYHGRFLESFSLPDSSAFEDWLVQEQEHLHRLVMRALRHLAAEYESQGDLERALHCAWRQLELEPWWESAHRQAMRLLARTGQRDAALAQYQTCVRLLAEELAAEPSAETKGLYEQIRAGRFDEAPPLRPADQVTPEPVGARPAFLAAERSPAAPPLFVAREKQLRRLDGLLREALGGQGQIAFVVGGAGRGKTSLLHEFARRALDAHPDLLAAIGTGDAYAGAGDPYLPFRQALGMLSGDVEAHWATGTLATEHAQRIWSELPRVAALLGERGPALVGTVLPARDLLARAREAAPAGAGWLDAIECLAAPACTPPAGLDESHLIEQYVGILHELAAHRPLLLLLDDLQWADTASLGLLFHLGRRIQGSRILIAAAYRPDEVALGRDGDRHPLEPLLAEIHRRFRPVLLDLADVDETEEQELVDGLLDAEPNLLDEPFRRALVRRTQGHPFFTLELVGSMKERGDLVRDEQGRWIAGERQHWEALPARAKATIAERIARLPDPLRQVLAVASVEGEVFTAQTVALVQGVDELGLLRALREELADRHRLVRQLGEIHCGEQSLSRYRFAHFFFQQHVYRSLGEGERRLLHRRVGSALGQLYAGCLDEVAVQLARHFAGDTERERRFLAMAGERAAAQRAHDEALDYLGRALELTPESEAAARFDLLLRREQVYRRLGQHVFQAADLEAAAALADTLADPERQAQVVQRLSASLNRALEPGFSPPS